MAKKEDQSLFQKLTKLFRSGPVVKRKIRALDTTIAVADKTKSSGALLFQKSMAPTYATITANAYNLSERLMRYQDFQEMEYCLHGDTKIAVPGGYKTLEELTTECEGKPDHTFIVYAYDHNLQRIVPAFGKQARQTRVDESYKVTFDNGQHVIGTPNHRLMKRDGTFCKIEDLKPGDAMMPFYRRDLFSGCKENGEGYRWIYSMDNRSSMNGWVAEHRIIGEMLKGSPLTEGEVVHHRNFVKHDNRPENLEVMTDEAHRKLHAEIINGAKWSELNSDWIRQFKVNHSKFMTENNPAERKDITFGRILEIAERTGFNSKKMCDILDTDPNVIKRRLRKHGYQNFETFAKAYNPDWNNHGWDNRGDKNPRYVKSITFDKICSHFSKGMSNQQLADSLGTTIHVIEGRIRERGYKNYSEFLSTYDNLKVVSVEPYGVIPLYDLTVDGYKNFATDTVVSHNTPELAAALDIYADETCLSGDSVIPLLDGTRPTIKSLYESNREDFWLYSFDTDKNEIVPGQATKVVKTGTKNLFRLNFDDGTFLRLTDNHRVLLSSGEYVHVRDLKIGDSIRSLYTSLSSRETGDKIEGYEKVLNPSGWKYTHRVVSEHLSPGSKGVVHHVDFNKKNNEPDNLRFMSYRDHQLLHASSNSYKWKVDKNYAEKMSNIFRNHALKMHQEPGFTGFFLNRRNEVFASYDENARKRLFGRIGNTNGMFGKGTLLSDEKNGRRRDDFVRSVSREQIVSWILSGKNTREICSSLPIKYEDLHRSMLNAGIKKWSKKYAVDRDDVQQKLKSWIKSQPESKDLNRFLSSACREIGITRKQAYVALESAGYAGWSDYLKRTNHKIVSIEEDGTEDVFDLEVKRWHNFATTSSSDTDSFVFVHNCAQDDKGRVLHIYSDNEKIREILEDLFYNTLNVEFNLRSWVRNLVKYGDMFLYNDVSPEHGVISAFPIPVNELEREENYDPNDPMAVRYRWVTLGNRTLENWEVTHFRLLGNDMFLPYGSSIIEPARRIWRQLILIEDAMLVYRVVRAPERRVFYIDVANIPPENVPMYVEEQRKNLRSSQVIDRNTGRVDLRYNPMPIHKDTPVPLLDGTTMTIENLSKKMSLDPNWVPWVYSVQDGTKKIVPGKVTWCGKNYTAKNLTKVWLDDGNYITTAPEHPFVMRDGSSKRADQLLVGDSLMSAYRDLNNRGYERIVEPSGDLISTHEMTARDVYNEKWESTRERVVHHLHPENGVTNKRDNRPENLSVMNFWEHRKMHAEHCELTLNRPELLEERRAKRIAYNKSPEKRRRTAELNKLLGKAKKMGLCYNGTELHASHNLSRREAQNRSWTESKKQRSEAMLWIIPNVVVSFVFDEVKKNPKIGREDLTSLLRGNAEIVHSLKEANKDNDRDISKFHISSVISKINRMGCIEKSSYSAFKRYAETNEAPVNHQVVKIESIVDANDDVYCMTVVGSNNEDDRHNFAVNGLGQQGENDCKSLKSLIFLLNSVDEDYFIPVRGGDSGTRIDTLAGGQNTAAVEDVAYIQKKLFAALKIPRAYLGYDESLSSKATLAQEDIRFSRTINVIQKTIVAELNKLAIIHLYAHGFDSEDLQNFALRMSNPSTIAQQQKLELWRAKFEIAGTAPEGQMSKEFIRKEIWGLNDDQCKDLDEQRLKEKLVDQAIESAESTGGSDETPGDEETEASDEEDESGDEEDESGGETEDLFAGDDTSEKEPYMNLLTSGDDAEDEDIPVKFSLKDVEVPVKAQSQLKRAMYNRDRIKHHGPSKTHMPNFHKMTKHDNKSYSDPYDKEWMSSYVRNPLGENSVKESYKTHTGNDVISSLRRMTLSPKFQNVMKDSTQTTQVLNESDNLNEADAREHREVLIIDNDGSN